MILGALTGLQLGWSIAPATASTTGSVDVSVLIEDGDLVFVMEEGSGRASFEMIASLSDGSFARTAGTVEESGLPMQQVLHIGGVRAGSYDLELTVRDLESGRTEDRSLRIEVPARTGEGWSSSGITILGETERLAGDASCSWQVYPPEGEPYPDSLRAGFLIADGRGDTMLEGWLEGSSQGRFTGTIPLGSVPSGSYDLMLAAVLGSDVLVSSASRIEVEEVWDVWGGNAQKTADFVRPIADGDLLYDLETAESETGRRAVMSEFWKQMDPTPMTNANEYLESYLERLDVIMDRFSTQGTPGIETDMGRVWALLGEPDIIQDMPFETDKIPYQVWSYFTPAITVLFVDNYGCGSYDLVTSWADIRRVYERI